MDIISSFFGKYSMYKMETQAVLRVERSRVGLGSILGVGREINGGSLVCALSTTCASLDH